MTNIAKTAALSGGSPTKPAPFQHGSQIPAYADFDASLAIRNRRPSNTRSAARNHSKFISGKSERIPHDGSTGSVSSVIRLVYPMSRKHASGPDAHIEVMQGPILEQIGLHFVWHAILLVLSNYTGIAALFYYDFPIYISIAFVVWQISRYIYRKKPVCIIPIYLTFLAYIPFNFLARGGRMIFSGLWFASIMGIFLQINKAGIEYHLFGISTCFLVSYVVISFGVYDAISAPSYLIQALGTSSQYISETVDCLTKTDTTCTCPFLYTSDDTAKSCIWSLTYRVGREQEFTFIFSILLICMSSFVLQQHVREYAFNLLDRQYAVMTLSNQNANLQQQLKEMRTDVDLDLDSPITKVIKVIRDIQANGDLEADVMESLDYVILLLSSNQLFTPNLNINKDAMDTDVNKWLNAMIMNQETQKPKIGSNSNLINDPRNLIMSTEIIGTTGYGTKQAHIIEVLEKIDTWDFDIFELTRVTNGRPLYYLGMALFEIYNFRSTFNVEESVMRSFLAKTESAYKSSNAYHNSTHAADVMHAMHYFLTVLGLGELITSEDAFAGIVAASIHDVDHPGYNNAFMIATSSPAAIRYNDLAVLENHHASKGFDIILNEPGCNILAGVKDQYKMLRASIVSMVLATDMTAHFEYITKFKSKMNGAGLEFTDPKDRQLCMDIAIKCGDVNNAAKSQTLCTQWAMNIMEEFFKQGDEERSRGLPISMFMDRQTTVISKCQVGFIDYIVTPLYEVWDQYMNDDGRFPAIGNLRANREYWKKQQDELQQQQTQQ